MDNIQISNFVDQMNSLASDNIVEKLKLIYSHEIEFIDPVKDISGLDALTDYFHNLYKNVEHCHFTILNHIACDNHHAIEWNMNLKHHRLAKNREIQLEGASFIRFNESKVCYHRDYYDLGALIYERIPILGTAVKKVRNAF